MKANIHHVPHKLLIVKSIFFAKSLRFCCYFILFPLPFIIFHTPLLAKSNNSSPSFFDASQHDFSENVLFFLDGQWDFYWNELLTPQEIASGKYTPSKIPVPHNWNVPTEDHTARPVHGYATYQARVRLPKNAPELTISTPYLPTSSAIYINDVLLLENGKVSKTKDFQEFNMLPITLPIQNEEQELTITIQISNYDLHKSGILHNVSLGVANDMLLQLKHSLFFSLLVAGGTFFLGLFFMLTIFTKRFNNRLFYFGLLIASFGYWKSAASKVYNHFFPDLDWIFSLRIEFVALFLANFAFMGFINSVYPKQNWKPFILFAQGVEILLIILAVFLPLRILFPIVGFHVNWIAVEMIYLGFVIFRAIKTKSKNIVFTIWGLAGGTLNLAIYLLQDKNIISAQEAVFFITNTTLLLVLGMLIVDKLFFDYTKLSKRAEIAMRVKSQFLSVVSHEMRTPMNAVIGMTELLAKTPLSESQTEYVEAIQVSGNSLITIIDDILDITRIQEGKIRVEQRTFDLHVLLKQTHKTFQKMASEKSLNLSLNIHHKVPQHIKSDPARIRQILDNLLSNAVKFTQKGSIHITVYTKKVTEPLIELHFTVEDTGIGIAAENLKSIFDQFSQEDSSLSRRHMGIGLGLPISRRLAQLMKGEVSVESVEGKGSVFRFFVSVEESQALPYAFEYLPQNTIETTLKILVAEDNLLNRKLILAGLKNIGYQADSVLNGVKVLEACRKQEYDIIFRDVKMPEMDGLEATRLLRTHPEKYHKPYIVALTANAFPEDKSAALEAGMDDYLIKPVKLELIQQILYQLEYDKKQVAISSDV
ncbi:MAG: ATP-binding protein [Bacteroidota bacterium]